MAHIVTITNPVTGQPAQVDQLDHTAQQIDDAVEAARWSHRNLLDNAYWANSNAIIDQRGGYVVPPGVNYFTSDSPGSESPIVVGQSNAYIQVTGQYDQNWWKIAIDGTTYAVLSANCVRGYTGSGYGIDRWTGGKKTILIEDGFITIKKGSAWLGTFIDAGDVNHWLNKTYTLSLLLADGSLHYGTVTPTENSGVYTAFDVNGGNVYLQFGWGTDKFLFCLNNIATNGDISPIAAKLELGTIQTLAHQENGVWVLNEIPDYGEQLARCQRYRVEYGMFAQWVAVDIQTDSIDFSVYLPVTMRAYPSIEGASNLRVNEYSDFAFSVAASNGNNLRIRATKSNHGLASAYLVAVGKIAFVAEL